MKRNNPGDAYFDSFMLWNDLAMKTVEMLLASARVIGHRSERLALAGPAPNKGDRREFALMGQEKIEASSQSARATALHLMLANQAASAQAFNNLLRSTSAYLSLANSRTPRQLLARQAALALALGRSAVSLADVSDGAARLAHRGLKPIHAKATANAKRLGKR